MREIKFRGIGIECKEWVFGYYVFCRGHHYILQDYNSAGYDERWETSEWIEVLPETVGQYTGKKDKEDVKIYEGDIALSYNIVDNLGEPLPVEVYMNGHCWCIKTQVGNCTGMAFPDGKFGLKIIGNITENSDLLDVNG